MSNAYKYLYVARDIINKASAPPDYRMIAVSALSAKLGASFRVHHFWCSLKACHGQGSYISNLALRRLSNSTPKRRANFFSVDQILTSFVQRSMTYIVNCFLLVRSVTERSPQLLGSLAQKNNFRETQRFRLETPRRVTSSHCQQRHWMQS